MILTSLFKIRHLKYLFFWNLNSEICCVLRNKKVVGQKDWSVHIEKLLQYLFVKNNFFVNSVNVGKPFILTETLLIQSYVSVGFNLNFINTNWKFDISFQNYSRSKDGLNILYN